MMTTCEVCGCTLDGDDLKTPVQWDDSAHYVCCYTCETVLCETTDHEQYLTAHPTVS